MLARRLYPTLHSHKLGTLAQYLQLPNTGKAHRALADAEVTANLIIKMQRDLQTRYGLSAVPHALLGLLQKAPKVKFDDAVRKAQRKLGL